MTFHSWKTPATRWSSTIHTSCHIGHVFIFSSSRCQLSATVTCSARLYSDERFSSSSFSSDWWVTQFFFWWTPFLFLLLWNFFLLIFILRLFPFTIKRYMKNNRKNEDIIKFRKKHYKWWMNYEVSAGEICYCSIFNWVRFREIWKFARLFAILIKNHLFVLESIYCRKFPINLSSFEL